MSASLPMIQPIGPRAGQGRGARRGMSLVEVMVVIAIALTLVAVLAGGLRGLTSVEHHKAAVRMTMLFQQLHDEAAMRNVTFRVIFDLQANSYRVEVGAGSAMIFSDPEARERFEKEQREKLSLMDEEEKAAYAEHEQPFDKLEARFQTSFELPRGLQIAGVYTPQYGRMMTREDLIAMNEERPEDPLTLATYVFPNGMSEHTVVWLREGDDGDGWTVEVEPLSGNIKLLDGLIGWEDAFEWVPDEGPELP